MLSIRNLPKNYKKSDLYLFESELKKKLNTYEILNYKKAILLNKLVITNKKIFNKEVFLFKLKKIDLFKFLIKEISLFLIRKKTFKKLEGKFLITTDHSNVYFHWTTEVLAKIVYLQNQNTNPDILINKKLMENEFIAYSLDMLNVQTTLVDSISLYKVKNLKFVNFDTSSGNYDKKIINDLSAKLRAKNQTSQMNRIWISRKSLNNRFIENEDEIQSIFEKYQIVIVDPSEINYEDQIELFQNCKFLSGLHGGGFTNMLFMPDSSTIFEIRQPKDNKNNCYFTLSSDLNHDYYYLESEYSKTNNPNSFYLNPNIFEKELHKIFSK